MSLSPTIRIMMWGQNSWRRSVTRTSCIRAQSFMPPEPCILIDNSVEERRKLGWMREFALLASNSAKQRECEWPTINTRVGSAIRGKCVLYFEQGGYKLQVLGLNKLAEGNVYKPKRKDTAENKKTFLASGQCCSQEVRDEGEQLLKRVQIINTSLAETINNLDFICIPSERTLTHAGSLSTNPLHTVLAYIEKVTSAVPSGGDLELILIDNIEHDKSDTGNSILGEDIFDISASGECITHTTDVKLTKTRKTKKMGTPGTGKRNVNMVAIEMDNIIQSINELHEKVTRTAYHSESDRPYLQNIAAGENTIATGIIQVPDSHEDYERHSTDRQMDYDHFGPQRLLIQDHRIKRKTKCFPGSSVVFQATGKRTTLEELQTGDKVLVRNENGRLAFDTVYMFGHREMEAHGQFIAFSTTQHKVFVTEGHYVYCIRDGEELCVPAEYINIRDCLLIASTEGFVPQPVENITYQRMRGLFAPFTHSGTIVVDNALMSCYIDVLKPTTCHTLLWPVRQMARISPRALAFINGSPAQHPVPLWAKAALKLI